MKKIFYGIVCFTSILFAACTQSRNAQSRNYSEGYYEDEFSAYEEFYDDLSPYGQWIDNAEFGRVWYPRETGFRPYYSNGQWAYTNYGWTWVSNYDWGWATFHYGRWFHDNNYGWMWVPGTQWAPAWVSWRQNSNYYGWAPLCPRSRNGRYYEIQNDQWAFVPQQYIYRNDLNNYYVNNQNTVTIINNTTIINNNKGVPYHPGPNVAEVERKTSTKIRPLVVKESTTPGSSKLQDGALHIYKPKSKNIADANTRQGVLVDRNADDNLRRRMINRKATKNSSVNPANQNQTVNDGVINNENTSEGIKNSPAIRNSNRSLNENRRRRQIQNNQDQNVNMQQNPASVTPNSNRQRIRINQDNDINDRSQTQPQSPTRNAPIRTVPQERIRSTPQQDPGLNQRQTRPINNPAVERTSRPLTSPSGAPVINRQVRPGR
jgi:hypothetical protein